MDRMRFNDKIYNVYVQRYEGYCAIRIVEAICIKYIQNYYVSQNCLNLKKNQKAFSHCIFIYQTIEELLSYEF